MLGRRARPKSDRVLALRTVADTALRSSDAVVGVMSAVGGRIDELAAFDDLPAQAVLVVGFGRVYDLLLGANEALNEVAQTARRTLGDQQRGA